jgi:putative transposase
MKKFQIVLTQLQSELLESISKQRTSNARDKERATIILGLSKGSTCLKLSKILELDWRKIQRCRLYWLSKAAGLAATETKALAEKKVYLLGKSVLDALSDAPRAGCPSKFSSEQYCKILAVSLENPADSGHPISHWSLNVLKYEVEKRGIVTCISRAQLGAFLKSRRM